MPIHHTDPDSLVHLISTFDIQREALEATRDAVTQALEGADWDSPKAVQFRALWAEQYVTALNNMAAAFESYKADVQQHLDNVLNVG
jgi:hypothetical protein